MSFVHCKPTLERLFGMGSWHAAAVWCPLVGWSMLAYIVSLEIVGELCRHGLSEAAKAITKVAALASVASTREVA